MQVVTMFYTTFSGPRLIAKSFSLHTKHGWHYSNQAAHLDGTVTGVFRKVARPARQRARAPKTIRRTRSHDTMWSLA